MTLNRIVSQCPIIYNECAIVERRTCERVKVREVIKLLQADGWYLVAIRGSHRQYEHPTKPGKVTLPGKPNDDVAVGTLASVKKQARLK